MSLSSRRDNHAVFDTADTIQGSFSLLNKNTRIRGSIGTSYLAPNGFQMSKTDYLEAETGSSYEIGIDHTFENLDLDFDITFLIIPINSLLNMFQIRIAILITQMLKLKDSRLAATYIRPIFQVYVFLILTLIQMQI